ncbi:lysozyme inhibitor LprI family protein [Paracoccus aerodenitrificans]|uniref:lysozyme inhibitor LprI family protein n=1 Tax=Paracoccus aerodenitrificans TaxID=3017781 RepID=UPI0022F011DF|nr:lysozyme inhibitor LprI family protein [Paracoccus aerodenitrificans]WBU65321.1 DUF1311 domain-containing protein [Paracoccus aerodenitrificans]
MIPRIAITGFALAAALSAWSLAAAQDFATEDVAAVPPDEPAEELALVALCLEQADAAPDSRAGRSGTGCIGLAAQACMAQPGGDSTASMIGCTAQETAFWDGILNESYQELIAEAKGWTHPGDPRVTTEMAPEILLRQMQRDWIAYRDSTCDWNARPWQGGSIVGVIRAGCLLDETALQALRLRRALHDEQGMR